VDLKAQQYQIIGWACLVFTAAVALHWCLNETGLAGWLIQTGEKLLEVRLVQISWLITFGALCVPGYLAKRYFDEKAWNEQLNSMPAPDIHASAKRSKYIKVDTAPPPAPKTVELSSLPRGQEEFIATCGACGHFFPAKAGNSPLKCPQCGEPIPIGA